MSKSLKKLIDINRLKEFKNKLVGAGSAYVQTTDVDQTIAGTKTFSKPIVGSVTGNAASATKLQTARTINGTSFNGTANITTANWGTARNISITDGTNTSTAVSVNGSANVALKLPATIKANLTGNSDTATKATQDSAGQQIDATYIKGLAVSGRTITYTKGDGSTGTITTQDTNTWTAFKGATSSANGTAGYVPAPTKGNQGKFFKADGTWATPPNTTYASMSASEATTGTATAARTISAKVLHDKINSNLSAYATKTELNNGLATKANDKAVVHKSGNETISGTKTFNDNVHATGFHATTGNAFMAQSGGYTLLLRNDGNATYLLMSDKDGAPGSFNSARPLTISNSTGVCNINGNAATATNAGSATNATYANWLRTSSHANHLFHTEWDNAGYFWTYVTAGNGEYRAVRVARSDSSGNADTATKLATARSLWGNNFDGSAAITGTITGTPSIEFMPVATTSYNGGFLDFHYNRSTADYTSRIIESASGTLSINNVTITTGKVVTATTFNGALTGNVTGNCSGSSGSCTGNSATATKLAAKRTIALSGAATGTATGFDGSGNITIPVTALSPSAIRAQWYAAYPDGPEAHNAMWGGRDITAAFNNGTVSANIANGTFRDIFPGDYITKQVTIPKVIADDSTVVLFAGGTYTVNWVIADCDYWINKGDPAMTAHHVAIVPQQPIFDARMNLSNTTGGGYRGSKMFAYVIPACATGIVNAFGSDHILAFSDGISNSVDTAHASSGLPQWTGTPGWWGEWVSVQCNLMSEKMVYGAPVCSAGAMDNTMATRQMSAFRLGEKLINYDRQWWWLRDVVSSAGFALVDGGGNADTRSASNVLGVRPFALLK